jgi:hypothetical protein
MKRRRNMKSRTRVAGVLLVVLALAGTGLGDLSDGLVAYYPFDGNSHDFSGNGNDATAYNDYEYVTGVSSQAIRLVGSGHTGLNGGHVILPFIALNEYPEFTISLWVNHQDNSSSQNHGEAFICYGATEERWCSTNRDRVQIGYNRGFANCRLSFHVGGQVDGSAVSIAYPPDFVSNWNHLVLSADDGTLTAYVNGESIGTIPYQLGVMAPIAGIGAHWFSCGNIASNRFIGIIDDVRIYDRVLSAGEIAALAGGTVDATVNIDPDTLNLGSKGKWVTCYIDLPDGYEVSDIDVESVLLEGLLDVQRSDIQDGVLMVKFDREDLAAYLDVVLGVVPPVEVELVVMGTLTDGTPFEGRDTIRVIDEGGGN